MKLMEVKHITLSNPCTEQAPQWTKYHVVQKMYVHNFCEEENEHDGALHDYDNS